MKLDASARILYEEALSRGIKCQTFDDNNLILMQHNGKQWYTRGSRTSSQSSVGKSIADLKSLTKTVLQTHHVPTARHVTVRKQSDLEQLNSLNFPLVMKPIDGAHGTGVIIGIQDIQVASDSFSKQNKTVIFEEMLQGTEYRIVCVNYTFIAAAFRKPAFVVGDGEHSVKELVDIKNQHPWRGTGHEANLTLITLDEVVTHTLAELSMTLDSVPAKDQEVFLRKTANLSTGGEAWDVTSSVCPENIVLFEKISQVCDLNTVGIDIMCQTLEKPIVEQDHAGVIEINASPGLRMHHYPMQGNPINVAGKILDMVLEKL